MSSLEANNPIDPVSTTDRLCCLQIYVWPLRRRRKVQLHILSSSYSSTPQSSAPLKPTPRMWWGGTRMGRARDTKLSIVCIISSGCVSDAKERHKVSRYLNYINMSQIFGPALIPNLITQQGTVNLATLDLSGNKNVALGSSIHAPVSFSPSPLPWKL